MIKKSISFVLLFSSYLISTAQVVNYEPNVKVSTFYYGTVAKFREIISMVYDNAGNLYVVNNSNYGYNQIQKITPSGIVIPFIGEDVLGPTNVMSQTLGGITVDESDNLYVCADNKIYKITPNGLVSTIAGSGTIGSTDGQGVNASFKDLDGITIDKTGNLYVVDKGNYKIRKISISGMVSTFAGSGSQGYVDGQGTSAGFKSPKGITIDELGNLYIAENSKIRKITPSGTVSTLAGTGIDNTGASTDGLGVNASIYAPEGITIDSIGNLYIAEFSCKIRKITPSGLVSTIAGDGQQGRSVDGQGINASINMPHAITIDAKGDLYVADGYYDRNNIRKITPSGLVSTLLNSELDGAGPYEYGLLNASQKINAQYFTSDKNGNFYFTENNQIRKINSTLELSNIAGSVAGFKNGDGVSARFYNPKGIVEDADGNIYIVDAGNYSIRKITPIGIVSTFAGTGLFGTSDGQGINASFGNISAITIDAEGNLYVCGYSGIRKITPSGVVSTLFSNSYIPPLQSIVKDNDGIFYGTYNGKEIIKITPNGTISTLAGSKFPGSEDGQGADASFVETKGMTIDKMGNLYVVDEYKIRKITPIGLVSTLAGSTYGKADGEGTIAKFYDPLEITIDGEGNLFVLDDGGFSVTSIRKISTSLNTGLENEDSFATLQVYPNPAADKITITQTEAAHFSVALFNILGKEVLSQTVEASELTIATDHLPTGLYVLKVKIGTKSYTEKVFHE